jgi:hypothetical protein
MRMRPLFNFYLVNKFFTEYYIELNLELRRRRDKILFLSSLLQKLITSAYITIVIYYLSLIFFHLYIISNVSSQDPSIRSIKQSLETFCKSENLNENMFRMKNNSASKFYRKGIASNIELLKLATFVNNTLTKTNKKHFLCYRTLFDLLRLRDEYQNTNSMDFCIYEDSLSILNVGGHILNSFFTSDFERELNANKLVYEFDYYYNYMYGFYHLTSKSFAKSEIFIYLFVASPETRLEFETIRRYGFFYIQYLPEIKTEYLDDNRKINKKRNLPFWNIFSTNNILENYVAKNQLILPSKIPEYMVSNMNQMIRINQNHMFPIPNDAHFMLMYFYSDSWYLSFDKCMI